MIINGGSRSNGGFFARHLMRADHNTRVVVVEIRGLVAENVRDAFHEMEAVASGTRAKNYFYHANLNTREDEVLTPEQWAEAADTLERSLGLTDQPRFVVEHEKDGRTHRHIVWSRIDADSMTAISDALTYPKHEQAARAIEQACGHTPVDSVLVKNRGKDRPERNPQDWESFRGQESKRDPKAMKAEITGLWQSADNGPAFAAALAERGYILARGDRRDFVLIDPQGDDHSLARRIVGAKAADIRARLADLTPASLPSVAEARALARDRRSSGGTLDVPAAEASAAPAKDVASSQPSRTAQKFAAPGDAAEAAAQVRAMAARFPVANLATKGKKPPMPKVRTIRPGTFTAAPDAAMAAAQVRQAGAMFARAIIRRGVLPEVVMQLVAGGLTLMQRTAHLFTDLVEEARDAMFRWRDHARAERAVHNPDDGLDLG